ncbi:hypothetical protein WMF27_44420 [Sorangium sp. So ce281]|uniref:hypothetical protein n=1 Tax=unclassified Sorangium TaxID=2621164 RepID=UPI003F5E649A
MVARREFPFAAAFSRRAPAIELHVVFTVGPLDLTRREADLALRLGVPAGEDSVASVDIELRAFASEQYAAGARGARAARGEPARVAPAEGEGRSALTASRARGLGYLRRP